MSYVWTVRDCAGHEVPTLTGTSRLDVGRRLLPSHYDAFRLHVSHSYREVMDRELAKVLSDKSWRIIRKRTNSRRTKAQSGSVQNYGFAN